MTPIVGLTMSVGHGYDQNYRGKLFIDDCKWKVGKKESASFCPVQRPSSGVALNLLKSMYQLFRKLSSSHLAPLEIPVKRCSNFSYGLCVELNFLIGH